MIKVGEKQMVIYGENKDGSFEAEEMTLKKVDSFKGKEIYIFQDSMSYTFVTYNHNNSIDWDFMEKINDRFGE